MSKLRSLLFLIPCLQPKSKHHKMSKKFPTSLEGFGYGFNKGKLTKLDSDGHFTEEGFQFVDQAHYEALGDVIDGEVYTLLEKEGGLDRISVGPSKPESFIFCSKDYMTSDKLLVLIHGSGVVRAGQWARRLIINEDLDKGTMLPFISHAKKTGWGVVVMNTNMNVDEGTGQDIEGSETPERHASTVWGKVVSKSKSENIVIIAHSYGGVVTMDLATNFQDDFIKKVNGVLMTDSVHYKLSGNKDVDQKLVTVGKNYVASDLEVGTPVENMFSTARSDIPRFSAGHSKHEWTSWSAMKNIFKDMEYASTQKSEKTDEATETDEKVIGEKNEEL